MASLLDLTVQGDLATIADEARLGQIKLLGPLELYPELAKRVQDKLTETLPAAAGVLVPPGRQPGLLEPGDERVRVRSPGCADATW